MVIVTPRTATPHLRGDTLEYNVSNLKLHINANVEEMLARLPGVQIDPDGGITVNGKKIQRLLLDGEDFFGGDPTVVTRNFNADMIAKVQILDKKSRQAEFTGVNDGQTTKTINLTLKDNSKQGFFSKVGAGTSPQGYYNINGILGAFKGRRQLGVLGLVANNGATGFGGNVGEMGAGLSLGGGGGDAFGASAGAGIPNAIAGGIHYADKWNGLEDHLVANYHFGQINTNPFSSNISRQVLPDSIYTQAQKNSSINRQHQHAFSGEYDYTPDSISAFHFAFGAGTMKGNNRLSSTGRSAFNDTLINSSQRNIESAVQNQNFNGSVMWSIHGAKEKRRNFSILAGMATDDNTTNGFIKSVNNFYRPNGTLLKADTTDQRKVFKTNGLIVNANMYYIEPLWNATVLAASYGLSFNKSGSLMNTYNKGDGKYQDYIDSLSNNYQTNLTTQRLTLNLQSDGKKISYTIGADLLHFSYRQADLLKDTVFRYQYVNIAPRIDARYNIDNYRNFSFGYSSSTQQPSITQLQPVQNNNDQLHIVIGNPGLRSSFTQNFAFGFTDLKPFVWTLGGTYSFTSNDISTKTITDSLGQQISQAVNVNGSKNASVNFSINKKLKPIDWDLAFNTNLLYSHSLNYLNQYLSRNDNYNTAASISLTKYVAEKYTFMVRSNFTYTDLKSSVNTAALTSFWTQNHSVSVVLYPFPGFRIHSNFDYSWRQKLDNFDKNNSVAYWVIGLHKELFQHRLDLDWIMPDILGQNKGITRTNINNTINESTAQVIGRYWMLSAVYHIISKGKSK
ncbi:outer membrane beta-barrel protein [Flavitalea flava]